MLFYHDTIYHQAKALVTDSTDVASRFAYSSVGTQLLLATKPRPSVLITHLYSSSILGQMFMDMESTC